MAGVLCLVAGASFVLVGRRALRSQAIGTRPATAAGV